MSSTNLEREPPSNVVTLCRVVHAQLGQIILIYSVIIILLSSTRTYSYMCVCVCEYSFILYKYNRYSPRTRQSIGDNKFILILFLTRENRPVGHTPLYKHITIRIITRVFNRVKRT